MGYRSRLTAVVYSGDEEALTTYMAKEKLEHGDKSIFTHFKGHLKRIAIPFAKETVHALLLELTDVKWYDEYDDVKAWTRFMEDSPNHDLNYELVRIGEDHDDIQNEQDGEQVDGLLYTLCTIEKDYPQPTKEELL